MEIVVSQLEKNLYEENKNKWKIFVQDAEKIWYSYQDLAKILKNIRDEFIVGEVREVLERLKKEVNKFSQKYDIDEDGEVDDEERKAAKDWFPYDLRNGWNERSLRLEKIKEATEDLEKVVSDYRQEIKNKARGKEDDIMTQSLSLVTSRENSLLNVLQPSQSQQHLLSSHEIIEMQNFEQQAQIEVPPK